MRTALITITLGLANLAVLLANPARLEAAPDPRPSPESRPREQLQKEADRHFKSGVALYKDAKYAEALAEFERAYAIAPHPLVLYNIAGCHRELLHYAQAVTYYRRFLSDGAGKVPAARLSTAQTELDALLTLVGRVTVTITPATDGVTLAVDDKPLDRSAMPLILAPGEHRLVARAPGRRDAEQAVQVAAGEALTVELALGELLVAAGNAPPGNGGTIEQVAPPRSSPLSSPSRRRLAVDAGFGMNLRRLGNTGAPSIGLGAEIGSRVGVGIDLVLVAYAVVPSIRVRVAGDALSLHVVGAMPVAFPADSMSESFLAVAGGLGLRYRLTPRVAFRAESYVSIASKDQGTTIPTFLGGELWF
jgi:hypothetical protein